MTVQSSDLQLSAPVNMEKSPVLLIGIFLL